ncbi:MAG TPA: FG-GAP-like repeat-containing protein, partial [Candidatus Saccharimonadales bacterium]|nr:FG-GAP-like repeat-containing protein [Candidatus Saccharimonadales bacterium]
MNRAMTRALLSILFLLLCAFGALAQTPVIDSFSPTSGYIGASVTISGSNFSPTPADNIVLFGTVRASVTAASADALVVSAPAGAAYQPITVTVGGLTAAARIPFRLTFPGTEQVQVDGHSSFGTSDSFPAPDTLLIGSLTGDGKLDMAVVGTFGNPSRAGLLLFKNTSTPGVIGAGSFANVAVFDLTITPGESLSPAGVALADLDGDGKPELLLTDHNHQVLLVYRNISTAGTLEAASFSPPVSITWPGFMAMRHALEVADFDGDGRPDIALATYGGLVVLRNVSSGGSLTASSFATPVTVFTNATATFVTIADLDLDGKPDLALVGGGSVAILRNTSAGPGIGAGTFAAPAFLNFTPPQQPTAILAGDMDCDGKLDLVVPHYGAGISGTTILRNLTLGPGLSADSFGQRIEFSGPNNVTPGTFAISDLNGDGKLDLVTLTPPVDFHQPSSISVLLNHCSGGSFTTNSFAPSIELALTDTSVQGGLSLADLDGDGRTDIVISRQNSSGTTSPKAYLTVYHNATSEPLSILPTVQIDSPTDGAIFTTGEDVAITANASDSDGSISRVSFFSGTNLLGSATNAPYTILWTNVQLGSYVLRAKAFDNFGDFTTS